MDPALRELLRDRSDPDRVIEAIIRLDRPGIEIPGVRQVAHFGPIATCRLRACDVTAVHAHPDVRSLKAARGLSPGHVPRGSVEDSMVKGESRAADVRRPAGATVTGAGVVVGVVDWGVDVGSSALRHASGATRFLAVWDQRDLARGRRAQPYGYGAVHDRAGIDRALRSDHPYAALGLHPSVADGGGNGAHGAHVIDIAAGNGRAAGPVGVAPEADLVFVHLADRGTGGLATLGDSVRLLEAVDFVRRAAGPRPWVVNTSMGREGGPHDGCTLVEQAFGELLNAAPGRFIVQSAGNYYGARTHAHGVVHAGESCSLTFVTEPGDLTPNELEIWYGGDDEFVVRIEPPGARPGDPMRAVELGGWADIVAAGQVVGRIYHRAHDPNNGDHHIDAFLEPIEGAWTVTLQARRTDSGRFDAWLERDDARPHTQARFAPGTSSPRSTIGTIANGRLPLVVGAYDAHDPDRPPARFSSAGPTRDGRSKPDLAAPGVDVLAARSTPAGEPRPVSGLVRKSGTSMAAPHVTGAVALCLEASLHAGRPLAARAVRDLLLATTDPIVGIDPECRLGRGYLDIARLLDHIPKEPIMDDDSSIVLRAPGIAYRECMYRPNGALARRIGERYEVLARPGERVSQTPRNGDLVLEITFGQLRSGRSIEVRDAEPDTPSVGRTLTPGRLLLRPTDDLELPAEDTPQRAPAQVKAQDRWTKLFGTDLLLKDVIIRDYRVVPSKAVLGEKYNGWTNSSTRIYIPETATTPEYALDVILRHEAVHIYQFSIVGRPTRYQQMVAYELMAYRKTLLDLNTQYGQLNKLARRNPAQKEQLNWTDSRLDGVEETIALLQKADQENSSEKVEAERERGYKVFLIENKLLPPHKKLIDLYVPSKNDRNPAAIESEEFADGSGDDAEFAGPEHKLIGDAASKGLLSDIPYDNPPQQLTFGDMISLAGDYFETYDEMNRLGETPAGRAELAWARWRALNLKEQGIPEPRFDPKLDANIHQTVADRYYDLAAHNLTHFNTGGTAMSEYFRWHGRALATALEAGQTSDPAIWQRAVTQEAFSDHFLTDMFAGGHVRTPRFEIKAWHREHFDGSGERFVEYLAKNLFHQLSARDKLPLPSLLGLIERWLIRRRIRKMGGAALRSFSLGDIVSLALHDHDNKGLGVISDADPSGRRVPGGYQWKVVGDGHLLKPKLGEPTLIMVKAAVTSSLRDLDRVRAAGAHLPRAPVSLSEKTTRVRAALSPEGFSARRFIPREDMSPSSPNERLNGKLEWRWGQLGEAAYQAVDEAVKGTVAAEIAEVADEVKGPPPGVRESLRVIAAQLRLEGILAIEAAIGTKAGQRPKPAQRRTSRTPVGGVGLPTPIQGSEGS
ncbi:S8 family serine peptidase [Streptomyces sp. SID13031]|uniref:S8 family serine peptidase n=1 Tax=Streptomyces sp. SID13031 TaxID=2706046 RepID=UPI0013C61215|nr:S8 family serine peptidase [Streptomyces sp. SID13031]NEA33398.1 S8 family serine peptidase [Streptomyces sp. SID13031]